MYHCTPGANLHSSFESAVWPACCGRNGHASGKSRRLARVCVLLALMCGWCGSAPATAADCRDAETLYRQAGQTDPDRPAARIALLRRAARVCPQNFAVAYGLGRAYLRAGRLDEAARVFETMANGESTDTRRQFARVRARQAQVAFLQAAQTAGAARNRHYAAARRFMDDAEERFGDQVPPWAQAVDKAIAIAMPVQEAIIVEGLTRAFVVCPRVRINVLFEYDRATLTPEGAEQVRILGQALERVAAGGRDGFVLAGHTDARGAEDYNQALSVRRARSVQRALAAAHPNLAGRIRSRGCGEGHPRYPGDDARARALNRRVEIYVDRPACHRPGRGACG